MEEAQASNHPDAVAHKDHVGSLEELAVVLSVLVTRFAGLYAMSIFDDAFITFRHATNLAAGHGLTFNTPDRVLGTTTPLFAIILAVPAWLGLPIPTVALCLGLLADAFSVVLGYRLLRRDAGIAAALGFSFFFAIDPHIIRMAVGGMESSIFFAASLAWAAFMAKKAWGAAFLMGSATVFLRPEAALLAAIAFGCLWLWASSREATRWTVVALALGAAAAVLLYSSYGALLPQSVASKGRDVGGSLYHTLAVFFFPEGSPGQWILTVLAAFGLPAGLRRSSFLRWTMLWTGGYVLAYLLARPLMWTWYGLPVYSAKALLAGVLVGRLASLLPEARQALFVRPSLVALASLAAAASLVHVAGPSPVRSGIYQPLRDWCRENVNPGQTVGAGDIGAVGFYCDIFVYDFGGLVWPQRWSYRTPREVILDKRPDYIFAEVSEEWSDLFDPSSELRKTYVPAKRFSRYGHATLDPGSAGLARGWIQDYVMFRRLPEAGM